MNVPNRFTIFSGARFLPNVSSDKMIASENFIRQNLVQSVGGAQTASFHGFITGPSITELEHRQLKVVLARAGLGEFIAGVGVAHDARGGIVG